MHQQSDSHVREKVLGGLCVIASLLVWLLAYTLGGSIQEGRDMQWQSSIEQTTLILRDRLKVCQSETLRLAAHVGKGELDVDKLRQENELLERENSLLSQTNNDLEKSTLECEEDTRGEREKREEMGQQASVQDVIERMQFENRNLEEAKNQINATNKAKTRNQREQVAAYRRENERLRVVLQEKLDAESRERALRKERARRKAQQESVERQVTEELLQEARVERAKRLEERKQRLKEQLAESQKALERTARQKHREQQEEEEEEDRERRAESRAMLSDSVHKRRNEIADVGDEGEEEVQEQGAKLRDDRDDLEASASRRRRMGRQRRSEEREEDDEEEQHTSRRPQLPKPRFTDKLRRRRSRDEQAEEEEEDDPIARPRRWEEEEEDSKARRRRHRRRIRAENEDHLRSDDPNGPNA